MQVPRPLGPVRYVVEGTAARWLVAREADPPAAPRPRLLDRLRVQDVDFGSNQIVVRGGKGDKDRVTMLPAMLKDALGRHLSSVRAQHQRDLAAGAGRSGARPAGSSARDRAPGCLPPYMRWHMQRRPSV